MTAIVSRIATSLYTIVKSVVGERLEVAGTSGKLTRSASGVVTGAVPGTVVALLESAFAPSGFGHEVRSPATFAAVVVSLPTLVSNATGT